MIAALALTLLAQTTYAPPRQGTDPLDQAREERVQRLGKQLRCPMCQGLSIADSQAAAARAQMDKVRELVAAGKSDDEIYGYFIARYGEWALLKPTANGLNSVLWVGPVALLLLGTLLVVWQARRRPGAVAGEAAKADDEYLKRVRAELEK